jgi:hypothetical protein
MLERLDRLPSEAPGRTSRLLWLVGFGAVAVGIGGWASHTLAGGVIALWAFCIAAAVLGLVLPYSYALVSPLFVGVLGWLVDMLPLVILIGWLAVVLRFAALLLKEKRLPRGGRWIWLPVALVFWTSLGILVVNSLDLKHFLLLFGIQGLASGVVLTAVDRLQPLEMRVQLVEGLIAFIVLLSVAVLLQWFGINLEGLQNGETRKRVETAYGVDAFPNNIGMIKYARSVNAGSLEVRKTMEEFAREHEGLPPFTVIRPKFQAYENHLIVRFEGSAKPYERELAQAGITLLYDNIALAPANTVPRMRSFPRNALTYAGICAALFPLAFFLVWNGSSRRRRLGWAGVVACLFGAAFSLARGAWIALAIGIIYLLIDGFLDRRQKLQLIGSFVAAAIVLTGIFFFKYKVDPLTGRAGGGASINTRDDLYKDTLQILRGPKKYVVLGYGTEKPRTESGTVKEGTRYVPRAGTHSTYLNYLFRTGVPGALMILALYVIAGLHARAAARMKDRTERSFMTLTAASIAIAGAHAVILSLYVEPVYTLTISLLIAIAMAGALSLPGRVARLKPAPTSA